MDIKFAHLLRLLACLLSFPITLNQKKGFPSSYFAVAALLLPTAKNTFQTAAVALAFKAHTHTKKGIALEKKHNKKI